MASHGEVMRRFVLIRHHDVTGASGTGIVAEGIEFSDGTVAVRWPSSHPTTSVWQDVNDVRVIHGHTGCTVVRWLDGFDRRGE